MSKINNNLILVFAILAFVFGLSLATPAYARGGIVESGVNFTPYTYPLDYIASPTPVVTSTPPVTTTTSTTTVKKTTNTTVAKTTTPAPAKVATASDVNDSYGNLTANALFGSNSFMPSGLVQWIVFAILILLIIFLWRYIHRSEEKYMSSPLKHA